jgi:hypothetical protein
MTTRSERRSLPIPPLRRVGRLAPSCERILLNTKLSRQT